MLDLSLAAFLIVFLAMGLRRPFVWTLAYLYVDILSPQAISYSLLTNVPISLIVFILAVTGWLFFDRKDNVRFTFRQFLIVLLLVYCGITTQNADFPVYAATKWNWVWKALVFALFLPLTLRTRLRLEAVALVMVISAGAIMVDGAIKTLLGGGGYGALKFFVDNNTGLYEGSTLSCVAIATVPLALWLGRHGTIFPADRRARLFAAGLTVSALLIPVGTEARTGLLCAGLLGILLLRSVKNRGAYLAMIVVGALVFAPLLPATFSSRMGTIENNQSDESATTRIAVWKWTLGYAADHPFGGGFDAYRGNHLKIKTTQADTTGSVTSVKIDETEDNARAFHSAYFEMLGEQGWPGLVLWLTLQIMGIVQLNWVRSRLKGSEDPRDQSDAALAMALEEGHFIYLLGALFVGIAYQPFIFMLIGLQIGLVSLVRLRLAQRGKASPVKPALAVGPVAPLGVA